MNNAQIKKTFKIIKLKLILLSITLVAIISLSAIGFTSAPLKSLSASQGLVVTAHPLASQAGLEMLKKGGNAVDAASDPRGLGEPKGVLI